MYPEKNAFLAWAESTEPDEHYRETQASWLLGDRLAQQIRLDDPPQVWQTAQRLLDAGMDRAEVWRQLVLTLTSVIMATDDLEFDQDHYVEALDRLPLQSAEQVEQVIVAVVRDGQPIAADEVERLAAQQLGLPLADPLTERLLRCVEDHLFDDDGPLTVLSQDMVVHIPSLVEGIVLTHRLTEAERDLGVLYATDLPALEWTGLRFEGSTVHSYVGVDGRSRWFGPPRWLESLRTDALLAIRVNPDGELTFTELDADPTTPEELVALLRSAYDAEVQEPWLPVSAEELLLGMLVRDRAAFADPTPPLTELAAKAGLEQRDERFAHDESIWQRSSLVQRHARVVDHLGTGPNARTAMNVLALVDEGVPDAVAGREVLRGLRDTDVIGVVSDELLGADDDPDLLAAFGALTDRLLAMASRPAEHAVAQWLAALADERRRAPLDAESHLRAAMRADPDWSCAQDRLAWYESDRGDALAAADRWRRLGLTREDSQDLATLAEVEPFITAAAGSKLGRNEPCWCGSGRKYKVCHRGKPALAPLPERVGWLCRKAVGYLERRGGGMMGRMLEYAADRATDPDDTDAMRQALNDPLVFDVALHEGSWFDRFLADRACLLPDDEAMLARAWTLIDRSVYEVLDVVRGQRVTVRDLRTGDRTEVRERAFSRNARTGQLVCARVVPDGETHQFIGGLFQVAPGTETQLLDLLDEHDGRELLRYVAELDRPPTLITSDGEPILECRAEIEVSDTGDVAGELDRRYERDGDDWVWFGQPDVVGGRTVRSWLHLAGDLLTVRALSAARLDALLADLCAVLPDAVVTRDDRSPVALDAAPPADLGSAEVPQEALLELADRQERRWCDEPVPALGGHTPREAAADPTRREQVVRLIASFPDLDPAGGSIGLRPARLRELLGLSSDD